MRFFFLLDASSFFIDIRKYFSYGIFFLDFFLFFQFFSFFLLKSHEFLSSFTIILDSQFIFIFFKTFYVLIVAVAAFLPSFFKVEKRQILDK